MAQPRVNIGNIVVGDDRVNIGNVTMRSNNAATNTSLPLLKGDKGDKGDRGEKGDPGTTIYTELTDKPSINDVVLENNKNLPDLNVNSLTNIEIEDIINSIV